MTRARDLADLISSGSIETGEITSLDAAKLTGTVDNARISLDAAEIPSLATSKVTSGTFADARISASSVTQHASTFDDTDLRNDIATLALHSAVADNKTAHSLPNMFIEQFEDDTGILTETDGDRRSGEFWNTVLVGENSSAYSNDANTLLLLHMDGSDGGTTFTDSSSTGHSITANGNVNTEAATSAYRKFGTAGCEMDGAGDFLTLPDHANWDFGSGSFTFDFWVKFDEFDHHAHSWSALWYQGTSSSNMVELGVFDTGQLQFLAYTSGAYRVNFVSNTGVFALDTWYHVAIVRNVNTWYLFKDGVSQTITLDAGSYSNSLFDISATPFIGEVGYDAGDRNPKCWIDEYRISNVARWTANWNINDTISATGTLICNTQTASAAQTKVSGVMLYKDNAGTATIGTDLKIYFSCDNGSNWTEAASYGTVSPVFSTGVKMIRLGDTTCTSGTQVKYKAVWANQTASKDTQLHGIGMNY